MAKIRTKLKGDPPAPPQAIIVDNPSEVTVPCLKVLRKLLSDNSIAFQETPLANSEVKFGLTGSSIQAIARDKYSVFLLLSVSAELFWLGTTLVFKRELGRYRLLSISLVIFKGDSFDEKKTPLLRAEWDNPDPAIPTEHAQPHWHVYPRLLIRDSTNPPRAEAVAFQSLDLSVLDSTQSEDDLAWPTSANFHYAMASTWQAEANGCQEKLNELGRLLGWLNGCISYSRSQLDFLFN